MLDLDRLAAELARAAADAGLDPASLVAFVVDARRPEGTTPIAYLNPAGVVRPDTVLVFRAAGAGRVAAQRLRAHRLALWRELPGIPPAALGPMLRHELEHARRFERSGPAFFDADDWLRAAARRSGPGAYARLPSEREANAAAAAYARARLDGAELASLADCADCAGLLAAEAPPSDVVEATLGALLELPGEELAAYADEVRRACATWAERGGALDLADGREAAVVELVAADRAELADVWAAP